MGEILGYALATMPILTIVLLLFWIPANMNKTAKIQFLGIFILFVIGILTAQYDFNTLFGIILLIFIIALTLWIFVNRRFFIIKHLSVISMIFALQIAFFFLIQWIGYGLSLILLCIVPILSMVLLYPWIFGSKEKSYGRVLAIIIFIVQLIFTILNVVLLILAIFYS